MGLQLGSSRSEVSSAGPGEQTDDDQDECGDRQDDLPGHLGSADLPAAA